MKNLIKTVGFAIILILAAIIIDLPIDYLFNKVAGPIGKVVIILVLFVLLCIVIWNCMKSEKETGENTEEDK